MSVDLPLPISTGRATSPVGASDGASATGSQGAPSAFDALMATLGPAEPTGDTQTPDDGAPAATTPEQQSDTTALPVAAQPATAVAPQLISALDLPAAADIAPLPTTAQAAPRKDGKAEDEAVQSAASSPIDEDVSSDTTPVALSVVTAEPAVAPVLLQTQTESAAPACQDATPATVKPVPLKAPAAARSGKASDADKNNDDARKPVTADAAPAPIAAPIVVLPQAQASVAAPVQPDASAPVPAGPPVAPVQDPLAQTGHPAPSPGPDASQTPAADTAPLPAAPIQAQPKPDALAGSLKAARKALTNDIDAQTIHTATPRNAAPSGFSLQPQADTQGSYTATGAQSGGMTQGGSNLARATVETLSTMSVQITRKLSEGNTKFAVELHPADLGKVEVTLSIARDGTTTAHLKFDTPVTAAAFQAQEGELRHQLAQSGLNLDGGALTFSSRDGGSAGGFGQSFAQMQQQNQPQDQSQSRQSQARAFQNAAAIADAADSSAAVDAGLLALRAGVSSTLALNLIV